MSNPNVDHPSHYGGGDNPYEVIKVMKAWLEPAEYIGAMKFNIHKYLARAGKKKNISASEDVLKAQFYQNELADYLKELEESTTTPPKRESTRSKEDAIRELSSVGQNHRDPTDPKVEE